MRCKYIDCARSNPWLGLPGAIFVGFALRVVWALAVPVIPVSDSAIYEELARSIVSGRGYAFADGSLTAFWPVGTSAVYAAMYALFGGGNWSIVSLNLVLGVGIIGLTHVLARRHFDERIARYAAWIIACWPLLIEFTTVLASELLFLFALLAALWVWGAKAFSMWWRALALGIVLCGAMYVRPTVSPLFVILPLLQYAKERNWRESLLTGLVTLLTAAALLAPWVARNQEVFGKFCLVSTNFGPNLWMGNNPDSTGEYMPLPNLQIRNEVDADSHFRRLALHYIRDNPRRYVELSIARLVTTFGRESIGVTWNSPGLVATAGAKALLPVKLVSFGYWWVVLVAAISGLVVALRSRPLSMIHPMVVIALLFFVVPILTVAQDRYHVPLNPFLAMFAAISLREARSRMTASGRAEARQAPLLSSGQ